MQKNLRFLLIFVTALALLGGAISLVRSTMGQGTDFRVFWLAGRAILERTDVYVLNAGGMIFKYPPWIATFFVPLALLPFEAAKLVWGIFSVACLFSVFWMTKRALHAKWPLVLVLGFLYWGIWVVHALDGQIAIPMLAITLLAITRPFRQNNFIDALSIFSLSTKIFTVFPWVVDLKRILNGRVLAWLILLVTLGTATVALQTHPELNFAESLSTVIHDWAAAASSGAKYLPAGLTRGPKNQSLSAFTCRLLDVPAEDTQTEVLISLLFFAFAGFLLWKHRAETLFNRFALAFAFTPVAHPLPWLHLFSWTFPLVVLTSHQWQQQIQKLKWNELRLILSSVLLLVALVLITLSSKRVLGEFGDWLEWHAAKGFGVVFLYFAYRVSQPRERSA